MYDLNHSKSLKAKIIHLVSCSCINWP